MPRLVEKKNERNKHRNMLKNAFLNVSKKRVNKNKLKSKKGGGPELRFSDVNKNNFFNNVIFS